MVATIIGIGWAVFWLGWLVASVGVKPGQSQWSRYAGIRLVIVVAVIVVLRTGAGRHGTAVGGPVAHGIGLALFGLGLGLAVWARVHIGRNWGTPMSRKDEPELITTGPYRFIRHPIYSGIILAMIGTALAIGLVWLAVAAAFGAYFVFSARREERYMTERFPEAYPEYRRTSKMLIPFVY